MKLFLLTLGVSYEGDYPIGVFSTEDLAMERACNHYHSSDYYNLTELESKDFNNFFENKEYQKAFKLISYTHPESPDFWYNIEKHELDV